MKQKLNLIAFFMCIFLMGYVTAINAQSVKQDAAGNYYAVKAIKDSSGSYRDTGKTFTDSKGIEWPLYESKNGKLFIVRVSSRSGNTYRQYIFVKK